MSVILLISLQKVYFWMKMKKKSWHLAKKRKPIKLNKKITPPYLPDACTANASQLVANTSLPLPPHNYFPQCTAPPGAGAKLLHALHLHIGHKHKRLHIFWCLCVHKSEHMCNVHTHVIRHILHRQHLVLHLVLRLTSRSSHNFPTSDKVLPRLPHSARLV